MHEFIKTFLKTGTLMSSKPGSVLVGYGKRTWTTEPSAFSEPPQASQPYFYSPDFFLKTTHPWFTHEFFCEFEISTLIHMLTSELDSEHSELNLNWTPPDYTHFQQTFFDLQRYFTTKELLKAVPYSFEKTTQKMTLNQLARSLISLLNKSLSRPMYLYGFWEKGQGILGGTPEILFSLEKEEHLLDFLRNYIYLLKLPFLASLSLNFSTICSHMLSKFTNKSAQKASIFSGKANYARGLLLKTMACAGTRKIADKDRLPGLLDDPKERYEHQLVVDGIAESLAPFGQVRSGQTALLQYPGLLHLVTPIQLELSYTEESNNSAPGFDTFVRALHPTPALGAFPRKAGQVWLEHYQILVDRQRYGAPIGYIKEDGKSAVCFVAIRNMQWNDEGIALGAGCGIVPDSNLEREWQEINAKLNAIKTILALNS